MTKIDLVMAKYIENSASEEESLYFLDCLSKSSDLRVQFEMAQAGFLGYLNNI